MDAWLTRLLSPRPAAHGTIFWWQGEETAERLMETLAQREIRHALAYGQGSEPMKRLADALVAGGLELEWVTEKTPSPRGEGTVVLTDVTGLPDALRLAETLRRQARRNAQRLQPIRRAEADETDTPDEPLRPRYALTIEDALEDELAKEPPREEPPVHALIPQEQAEEEFEGAPLLVLVPDTLELPPFAAMAAPPEGVALLPGFAGDVPEEKLKDARLSALVVAVEQLVSRKASVQVCRDAQKALSLMEQPLTPELAARMTLLAGIPDGCAASLGAAVHQAHGSVPLGEARLACLRSLIARYGDEARHGLHLCALGAGCGHEKAAPEENARAFAQWIDARCEEWQVGSAWRCLRNTELPVLAQSIQKQVRLAAPKRLTLQELTATLVDLKLPETDAPMIARLCERQQAFFDTGRTLPLDFRFERLYAVQRWLDAHEADIRDALMKDLGKSGFESYETEILMVREELRYLRTHLSGLAATQWYRAPLYHWPARCFTVQEPMGRVLIMAPWNYPFQLSMTPLLGAIAAGNCVVLKPSAYAPDTSRLLREMARELFDPEYVAVVEGGREENQTLLEQKFDFIFFTGSTAVGKVVLRAAAEYLTPVTLELGGKSPCIVDETADIALSARRIVWGKFLNAGQTCVAPDYVLCHESIHDRLVTEIGREIRRMFGDTPLTSPDLPRIVNRKHFERLCAYLPQGSVAFGGETDAENLRIAPTVLLHPESEAAVMQDEIFGPILPVVGYRDLDTLLARLRERPKPLAAYLFTRSAEHEEKLLRRLSFGGGCINDTICHVSCQNIPFGGVGESGMGSYHGRKSFETFSHAKPLMKKSLRFDLPVRYAPYRDKLKWLRRAVR